jgi:CheY-like chemotaxis protein
MGILMHHLGGLRVLVVEDHGPSAEALALFLRAEGHEVHIAADGAAALEAVRQRQPDVVFLDILLPDIDGFAVARGIQEQSAWRRPLLVALTGCGDEDSLRRSRQAGIDLHLVKPVPPGTLRGLLLRFQAVVKDVADFDPKI